jgi:hypothetical protein
MNLNSTNPKKIRNFGWVALIFFGSLLSLCVWLQKPFAQVVFSVLAIIGLGFIIIPKRLARLYNTWMRISHFIGQVVTAIMLSLGFYLVITPAGMIKRIFGGRPLPLKPDRKAATYWIERAEPAQPKERFIKRF